MSIHNDNAIDQPPFSPDEPPYGNRITREEKFVGHLDLLARRSTCLRGQVSAIIVRDKRVVSEGYNGAPPGMPHCLDVGCEEDPLVERVREVDAMMKHQFRGTRRTPGQEFVWDRVIEVIGGCTRTVHAEANAIAFAARHGIPTEGAEMWCQYSPCLDCAKLIVSAGIVQFTYIKDYRLGRQDILDDAGLEVIQFGMEG